MKYLYHDDGEVVMMEDTDEIHFTQTYMFEAWYDLRTEESGYLKKPICVTNGDVLRLDFRPEMTNVITEGEVEISANWEQ